MRILERSFRENGKEYALRVIRENIINLELSPGTIVSANELASELGISRGPVREALNELSKIGIVEVYPQSGCRITLIDYTMVNQARFLRNTLENAVVKEVCHLVGPEDIIRLEENVRLQEFYQANNRHDKLLDLDNEFHKMLFEISNKMEVYRIIKNFDIHSDRLRTLTVANLDNKVVVDDHKKIMEAITAHDEEEAERLMNMHLTRYTFEKEELLPKSEKYFK